MKGKTLKMRAVITKPEPGLYRACLRLSASRSSGGSAALIRGRGAKCGEGKSPRAALQLALRRAADGMGPGAGYGKRVGHKRYGGK